jgi:DNA polymerase III subunit gamma/tau
MFLSLVCGGSLSYQVIARKWRPQSFDQLVGQNHISTTLLNAIRNNRLPHALLLTGPRGTGKTTTARILAKSIRCPNAVDFVPCHVCSDCEEIARSMSPNVIEIDGASNNGVDAVRELREGVVYSPSSGHYKVYIIDEVHMLSTAAFNALLKTLEEPPPHVIFIMATTEVHKIPQTIMSRCQRFDFRRIPTRQITDKLKQICESEKISFEDDALWMIARQAGGSMRDSQSLLDQVITFANGPLTRETVTEVLGLTDQTLLLDTLKALVERNSSDILNILTQIQTAGYEADLFIQDLLQNIRHLLMAKISGDRVTEILELPDSEIRFLVELSKNVTAEDMHMLFDMALKGSQDIIRAQDSMTVLEIVLLRMAAAPQIQDITQFFKAGALPAASSVAPSAKPAAAAVSIPISKPIAIPQTRTVSSLKKDPQERWFEFVQDLKSKEALLGAKIEPLAFSGIQVENGKNFLQLDVPSKMSFLKEQLSEPQAKAKLQSYITEFWGPDYILNLKTGVAAPQGKSAQTTAAEKLATENEKLVENLKEHPKVKAATKIFGGQVTSIRNSQEET